jgi:hypothetical protein
MVGVFGMEEVEPNDSMDEPQSFHEGKINGTVNGTGDPDVFRIDVAAETVIFYSLKKTDTGPGELILNVFDSYRRSINVEGPEGNSIDELSIAGEMVRGLHVNRDTADYFFIAVSGNGNYTVEVLIEEMNDPDDAPGHGENADIIEIGDEREGRVFELEYGYLEFEDVDRYIIPCDRDGTLKVRIEKADSGNGSVFAGMDIYPEYVVGEVELSHRGDRRTLEEDVYIYGEEEENIYLSVWGEGDYLLEIGFEEGILGEELLLGLMGAMMCFYLLIFLVPIIAFAGILILVIWLVIKGNNDRKEIAKKRRGRTQPGKVRKIPNKPPR